MIITLLSTVFVLGVLIFVHELGHFAASKLFKIRVDRFSMGFPPRLFGKKIGETDYCISAVPVGGYVKIAGMVDESMDVQFEEGPPQPWEFRSRSWIQKVIVISAGSVMNLVLAFLIIWGGAFFNGYSVMPESWADHFSIAEHSPADLAGIEPGDRIISVDGKEITDWADLTEIVYPSAGKPLQFSWQHGDSVLSKSITPMADSSSFEQEKQVRGLIGLKLDVVNVKPFDFFKSFNFTVDNFYAITREFFVFWYQIITGTNERPIRESLGGPIRIAQEAGRFAQFGFLALLEFMAIIGINLGLLNLLPFPVLDGGHLVYIHLEAIFRKTIPLKTKLIIQQVGMILLVGFMIFVLYNDILGIIHK